jgi:hypothetical protein
MICGVVLMLIGFFRSRPSVIIPLNPDGKTALDQSRSVGDTAWKDVRFYENTDLLPTTLVGLGSALISVFLIELLSNLGKQWFRDRTEKKFEEFFGVGALSRGERGRIILQADRFEELIVGLTGDDSETTRATLTALDLPENNRLYKARTLLNAKDAEGAKIVRHELRQQGFPTPELDIIERHGPIDPFSSFAAAPYLISMGLAFTETTIALTKEVGERNGCIYIDQATEHGDALVVRGGFVRGEYNDLDSVIVDSNERADQGRKYYRLFPKNWDLRGWLENQNGLKDYAVIIRHTASIGNRKQIRFILAGFTEDSTTEAARYLVFKWNTTLWRIYSEKKSEPTGDFVVVISGITGASSSWSKEPDIEILYQQM